MTFQAVQWAPRSRFVAIERNKADFRVPQSLWSTKTRLYKYLLTVNEDEVQTDTLLYKLDMFRAGIICYSWDPRAQGSGSGGDWEEILFWPSWKLQLSRGVWQVTYTGNCETVMTVLSVSSSSYCYSASGSSALYERDKGGTSGGVMLPEGSPIKLPGPPNMSIGSPWAPGQVQTLSSCCIPTVLIRILS